MTVEQLQSDAPVMTDLFHHGYSFSQAPAFEGRVALVTGGGSGIGEACTRLLVAQGAAVAVLDIDGDRANRLVESLCARGHLALSITVDVQDETAVDDAVAKVLLKWNALHIAVNSAGTSAPAMPIGDYSTSAWRHVLQVNLDALFFCMRSEIRAMRKSDGGAIVNLASILGRIARPGSGAYVTSKHGVIGLTMAAALDHAADRIRINAVAPGHTRTPLLERTLEPERRIGLEREYPLGRLADPMEIAAMVAWLASDQSSFVTGACYPVDGGYLAR